MDTSRVDGVKAPQHRGTPRSHREAGPERVAQLRLVDDHDELVRDDLDHLLPQQGAAAALDQIQIGIDLVGTVDRDVEPRELVQRGQRNTQLLGLFFGSDRSRHGDDVLERAIFQEHPEPLDRERGRRARAQADLHAARHIIINSLVADLLLELVLRRHGRDGYGRPARRLGGKGCCS